MPSSLYQKMKIIPGYRIRQRSFKEIITEISFSYCEPWLKQQKGQPLLFGCFCNHTFCHNLPCRQLQPWTQTVGGKSSFFPLNIPLHPTRNTQLLAQQSLTTAVHKSLEGVQTLTKGRKEGVMAKDAQRSQSAVPRAMAAFGQTLTAR